MRTIRLTLVAALAALALAACGGGAKGDEGVASLSNEQKTSTDDKGGKSEKDVEAAFLAFAKCMREHGIDMPDPTVSEDGRAGSGFIRIEKGAGEELDEEKFKAADAACRKHLDGVNAGAPGGADPAEFQDKLLKLARCMRDKGFDMPDPKFDGGRAEVFIGEDEEDPEFRDGRRACSEEVGLPEPGDMADARRAK